MTFPDTPAGRILSWWIEMLETPAEEMSWPDFDARFNAENLERFPPDPDEEVRVKEWRRWRGQRGPLQVTEIEGVSPLEAVATVENDRGRRSTIRMIVEEQPPHLIIDVRHDRIYGFDLVLRLATQADAKTLADIERRSPVVVGDTAVAIDRGDDYLAMARLMEDVSVILAEVEGEPAAVGWGAWHRTRILGKEKRVWYFFHLRVLPEHQRKGLWGAINNKLWEMYGERTDHGYGFFVASNVAWQHVSELSGGAGNNPQIWRNGVNRAILPTAQFAGPPVGRQATLDDARRVVELINDCHEQEEMFLPYGIESLTARLSRDLSIYSWNNLWLTEGAVVGVWPAGEKLRVMTEQAGERTVATRGLVLDYGFLRGAEDEFEALLRGWSGRLRDRGVDELSVLTSRGSRSQPVVRGLTDRVETFLMTLGPRVPEPSDIADRGLYADHVYF